MPIDSLDRMRTATTVLLGTTRTLNADPADTMAAGARARTTAQLRRFDHRSPSITAPSRSKASAYQAGLVSEAVSPSSVPLAAHGSQQVPATPRFPHKTIGSVTQCSNTFADDFRARYAIGGSYLIHIAVRNGHVTLAGVVHSYEDIAEVLLRARAVATVCCRQQPHLTRPLTWVTHLHEKRYVYR